MSRYRRVLARVLDAVRRGPEVVWAPEWMGLGNLLYLSHWAYSQNLGEGSTKILLHPDREASLRMFPVLRDELFVRPREVRFTDRRVMPWSGVPPETKYPERFDNPNLMPFIRSLVLPDSPILGYEGPPAEVLVINVRRGDYYSNPVHRAAFGINIVGYVKQAVAGSIRSAGTPDSFWVVSDDERWCREHLGPYLEQIALTHYQPNDPIKDFCALSTARRLILANSTFSYWGGYVGDALLGSREVWAPSVFNNNENGGRAYQLLPEWNVVEEVPGGWTPVSAP